MPPPKTAASTSSPRPLIPAIIMMAVPTKRSASPFKISAPFPLPQVQRSDGAPGFCIGVAVPASGPKLPVSAWLLSSNPTTFLRVRRLFCPPRFRLFHFASDSSLANCFNTAILSISPKKWRASADISQTSTSPKSVGFPTSLQSYFLNPRRS